MQLPKNIALSAAFDRRTLGKMVRFFDVQAGKYVTEKHTKDHDEYMRKADAALLHHIIGAAIPQLEKLRIKKQLKSGRAIEAMELLQLCFRVLSPKGDNGELFAHFTPYSAELIATAAEYINIALPDLDPTNAIDGTTALTALYRCLVLLSSKAQSRYEIVTYNDVHQ